MRSANGLSGDELITSTARGRGFSGVEWCMVWVLSIGFFVSMLLNPVAAQGRFKAWMVSG
jgi:hypothetical protein